MAKRKTAAERRAAEQAAERERWVAQGYHFAVVWFVDGKPFGPHSLRSMAEAEHKRDDMILKNEKPIPKEYYERQAHLVMMTVAIEAYRAGRWVRVEGSERECVYGVDYAD